MAVFESKIISLSDFLVDRHWKSCLSVTQVNCKMKLINVSLIGLSLLTFVSAECCRPCRVFADTCDDGSECRPGRDFCCGKGPWYVQNLIKLHQVAGKIINCDIAMLAVATVTMVVAQAWVTSYSNKTLMRRFKTIQVTAGKMKMIADNLCCHWRSQGEITFDGHQ